MKHNLLIFLLLLAFNVNAIASQMMLSDTMSGMDMSLSMDEMSAHVEINQQIASGCDKDISCSVCLAHCNGVMVLIEVSNFSFQNRLLFNSTDILAEASRRYFRLLRPPKLSRISLTAQTITKFK